MEKENSNQSAFPSHGTMGEVVSEGLTKREYFAGLAMQGILANSSYVETLANNCSGDAFAKAIVEDAIKQADELLKQLEQK